MQLPQAKRGTPCYMAPELFQEGSVHSFGSDLWALGCVMYECYTGRPPFVSSSFTQLVDSIISDPMPSLWGKPSQEFEDLVNRLLVKDPTERLQWAELRDHPFWRTKCKALPLPPQPALVNFLNQTHKASSVENEPLSERTMPVEKKKTPPERAVVRERVWSRGASTVDVKRAESNRQAGSELNAKDISVQEKNGLSHTAQGRKVGNGLVGVAGLAKEKANGEIPGVNLLRLSKIVKSNLLKEAESETYRQQANSKDATDDTDVTIENHDLELNFAEGAESDSNDEEDEGVDASSPTVVSEENVPPRTVSKPGFTPADKVKIGEGDNANEQALPHFTQTESNGEDESPPKVLPDIEGTQMDAPRQVAATPPGVGIPRKGLQRAVPASGDPKKAGSTVPPTSTKLSVVLSQSLWHPTDLAVRPIMLNRRIEKVNPLFL